MRIPRPIHAAAAAMLVAAAPAATQPLDIAAGQTLEGRFSRADPTLPDGSHFRDYRYRGTPGEQVTVTMRSTDFDAFLSGGAMHEDHFDATDHDDDGAGGGDARIVATVPADGEYHIRANTLLGGTTGAYTLTVQTGAGSSSPPAADRVPVIVDIAAGEVVAGRFSSTDPLLPDGTHFRMYRFQGTPGQPIVATLRSPDFDAFLIGGTREGAEPGTADSDDDGAGGTDAEMRGVVGASGEYFVTANTLLPGETGAYTLTIRLVEAGAGKR